MTDTATITLHLRVELRAIVSWEIGLFRVEVTTRDGRLVTRCHAFGLLDGDRWLN